jgi:hypothetical protein
VLEQIFDIWAGTVKVASHNATAAALLSLVHSAMTARAAPTMFQIGRAGDDPAALALLLARFAHWSTARAAAQTATLIVVAIAVALGT